VVVSSLHQLALTDHESERDLLNQMQTLSYVNVWLSLGGATRACQGCRTRLESHCQSHNLRAMKQPDSSRPFSDQWTLRVHAFLEASGVEMEYSWRTQDSLHLATKSVPHGAGSLSRKLAFSAKQHLTFVQCSPRGVSLALRYAVFRGDC
jgi:hypothetical protein